MILNKLWFGDCVSEFFLELDFKIVWVIIIDVYIFWFFLIWCVFLVIDWMKLCVFWLLIILNELEDKLLLFNLGSCWKRFVECVFECLMLFLNDCVGFDWCFNLLFVGNCGFLLVLLFWDVLVWFVFLFLL